MPEPFQPGDMVVVEAPDGDRLAVVTSLIQTDSVASWRRWRLLCRWADHSDSTVDIPLHCGDDGIGEAVKPAATSTRSR